MAGKRRANGMSLDEAKNVVALVVWPGQPPELPDDLPVGLGLRKQHGKAKDFVALCPDGTVLATHRKVEGDEDQITHVVVARSVDKGDNAPFEPMLWCRGDESAAYELRRTANYRFQDSVPDPEAKRGYRLVNPRVVWHDLQVLPVLPAPEGTIVRDGRLLRLQTATKAFRAWFGASKITDRYGDPLEVYHGTPTGGFDAFEHVGKRDSGWLGRAIYLTRDKTTAKSFTSGRSSDDSGAPQKQVLGLFVRAENPIHLKDLTPEVVGEAVQRMREATGRERCSAEKLEGYISDYREPFASGNQVSMARELKHLADPGVLARYLGHDALLSDFEGGTIAVFRPEQVKSSTDNTGAFDLGSPNFRA